jgi:hypothetical protein
VPPPIAFRELIDFTNELSGIEAERKAVELGIQFHGPTPARRVATPGIFQGNQTFDKRDESKCHA